MAFSESVIISCFVRSEGRCECRRDHPEHRGHGRCKAHFSRNEGWVAYRVIRNAPETLQNCELLCPTCAALAETGWYTGKEVHGAGNVASGSLARSH